VTASAGAVGWQWQIPAAGSVRRARLGIDAEVSLDVFTQLDRCETRLHGCWPTTEGVMLSRQFRQLLTGQQQFERAALARCPLDESQLLQAQDHLMD
jgi:hypothetical protein